MKKGKLSAIAGGMFLATFLLLKSLGASELPQVTLDSPSNGTVVTDTSVNFMCSAQDDQDLQSTTLYFEESVATSKTFREDGTTLNSINDTQISADTPSINYGSATDINIDGQTPHAHALIKFPNIFGDDAGQVPLGAQITSATITANCTNPGNNMQTYLLKEDWVEGEATWNNRTASSAWSNPGADGPISRDTNAVSWACTTAGVKTFDVKNFVQAWSDGEPNYGIVVTDTGTDGVDFSSGENSINSNRPLLTVNYRVTNLVAQETKSVSGASASAQFTKTLNDQSQYKWTCGFTDNEGQESRAGLWNISVDTAFNASPAKPSLVGPVDNTTGITLPVTLEVSVSDPENQPLDVEFYGKPVGGSTSGDFTLMVIPDTQYYTQLNNGIFEQQTQWIAGQVTPRNIFFATHEGDVVENWDVTSQWIVASTSMATLDGVLPYGINVGNHDMSGTRSTAPYNQYFGPWRYSNKSWYKEGFPAGTNDNSYQIINQNGMDFLFLNLEFCPTSSVINWANGVLDTYPNHRTIVTTHGYLDLNANRNVSAGSGGCVGTTNNTQYIWDQLIYPNPQVFLVLAGHTPGESRRTDLNIAGKPVYQLLSDYQNRTNGGNGWLRIMTFKPSEGKIYVETYSPYLNTYETDAGSQFTLDYEMNNFNLIGTSENVSSGSNATVQWSDLSPATEYEWFAKAIDSAGKTSTSSIWSFTTDGSLPPNANAGADQSKADSDGDGSESITLNGNQSSDQDGSIVSYEWKEGVNVLSTASSFTQDFPVGVHTLTLTVTDDDNLTDTDNVTVTVTANTAPVANAGADQNVSDADRNGTQSVTLNGSASNDPDGTITSYEWKEGSTVLSTESSFTQDFAVGSHSITLSVTDNAGATHTDSVTVTVEQPPLSPSIHVGNISFTSEVQTKGQNRSCRVTANVTVLKQDNTPASGTTVAGSWSGALTSTVTKQTSSNGIATIRTSWINGCGNFIFTVNNLTLSGYIYNSSANTETSDNISL